MKVVYKVNGKEVAPEEFRDPANLQDMLESGQGPRGMTDSVFLEGHTDNAQQQTLGMFAERYKKQALAAGVNPKGKKYIPGLAQFPGDPGAWVSGRGDVKKIAEKRNLTLEEGGAVTNKHDNSRVEG